MPPRRLRTGQLPIMGCPVKSLFMFLMLTVAFSVSAAAARENVAASESYFEPNKNADSREKLADVAANVRREMQAGGRFQFVPARERDTVNSKFSEMDGLFARSGSVAQMNDDQKTELFNAQEVINSILTERDRDRLSCKNAPIIGSHIRSQTCTTYGEQLARTENAKKQMLDWQTVSCKGGGLCGVGTINEGAPSLVP